MSGRVHQDLGPDAMINQTNPDQVECIPCRQASGKHKWQSHGNWSRHIASKEHVATLAAQKQQHTCEALAASQYSKLYSASAIPLVTPAAPPSLLPRPGLTWDHLETAETMSMYTHDIGLTADEIAALFPTLEDVSAVKQQQEEELRHEKDRLILAMEEESYLDDELDVDVDLVDEMATNFCDCGACCSLKQGTT
ncbi:hypothetical protein ARMSODRAFT_1017839 [Armillaria solidipes]|uniref:Uncharacterized protein n=1 Tax=Armillaria solidipes TaxID=1076256 RepID=A0A2H3BW60_9AGAR|nr:hypothetical protein ARMSODRAFT_1017839 [Armillaria solidipes]